MTGITSTPPPKKRDFNWHKRYLQQAKWTRELREYIFKEIGLNETSHALEVGCGTGAILSQTNSPVFGLDIELASAKEAKIHAPTSSPLTCADTYSLPYADNSFEVVFCHFLLLWLRNPADALYEMIRVSKAGGHIIAFAEPDYSQRVDKPDTLAKLGRWQTDALRAQGANPSMGAELAELFFRAGITIVETGTISTSTPVSPFQAQACEATTADERANEWETIESDLAGIAPDEEIQKMKLIDHAAWVRGERVLHVPTYYLWGRNKV